MIAQILEMPTLKEVLERLEAIKIDDRALAA